MLIKSKLEMSSYKFKITVKLMLILFYQLIMKYYKKSLILIELFVESIKIENNN